jgi:hypothetical protein
MDFLDAHHKDEILLQLLSGEWQLLFPENLYSNLTEWFQRQQKNKEVVIRFICQAPKDKKFAVYFLCSPKTVGSRVQINDLKYGEPKYLLAVPPAVYELPLYCTPEDLYSKILSKKRKN